MKKLRTSGSEGRGFSSLSDGRYGNKMLERREREKERERERKGEREMSGVEHN